MSFFWFPREGLLNKAKVYFIKFLNVKAIFFVFCFRKYIQVCVQNLSELDFRLSDSDLVDTGDGTDLQLLPLNTKSQQVTIFQNWAWTQQNTGEQGVLTEPPTRVGGHGRWSLFTQRMVCWWSVSSMCTRDCWEPPLCATACMSTPHSVGWVVHEGIRFSLEELNLNLSYTMYRFMCLQAYS